MNPTTCTYIVACHTDSPGVLRLVRRIRVLSPGARVLVRYDVPGLFAPGEVEEAGGIAYLSAVSARWGDWSLVDMQLDLFEAARRLVPADRYVLISGQDYPIRSLEAWERGLDALDADAFLDLMEAQPAGHELTWRVLHEPRRLPQIVRRALRSRLPPLVSRVAKGRAEIYPVATRGATRWMVGLPRHGTSPIPVVKAALWMTLEAKAVDVLLDAAHDDGARAFFRTVRNPDEFYAPSLLSAAGVRVLDRPTSAKRFRPGAANPDWVDLPLLRELAGGPAAFVRKIGPDVDPAVLAAADAMADAERADGRVG